MSGMRFGVRGSIQADPFTASGIECVPIGIIWEARYLPPDAEDEEDYTIYRIEEDDANGLCVDGQDYLNWSDLIAHITGEED